MGHILSKQHGNTQRCIPENENISETNEICEDCEDCEECKANDEIKPFDFNGYDLIGECIKVYDGDTIWVNCNFGHLGNRYVKVRLLYIDCSEVKGDNSISKFLGWEARKFLIEQILNKIVIVRCKNYDMYGRILGEIFVTNANDIDSVNVENEINIKNYINNILLKNGHAITYKGTGKHKNEIDAEICSNLHSKHGIPETGSDNEIKQANMVISIYKKKYKKINLIYNKNKINLLKLCLNQ